MKNLIILLAIIFISLNSYATEDTLKINTDIERVTVFLRGGELNNKAKLDLPKGTSRVMFTHLSPYLDVNSIQVKSTADVTILSVVHQYNFLEISNKSEKVKLLESEKKQIEEKLQMEQSMVAVYKQEEELILANKKLSSTELGVNIEELKKAAAFYREKLTEIKTRQLEIMKKIEKYNADLGKITSQLNELNARQADKTSEVIVTLACKNPLSADFTISYFVDKCGWVPKYNLRAKNVDSPLELNYKAEIYQNTGYDWSNVEILLSTGEPLKSGTKPELQKWVLSDGNFAMANNKTSAKNFTNTSFLLKTRYSIPSNGKNYSADLIDYNIPATYKYSCVPKIEEAAFLMAEIANWEQYNLLSGQVNLFFEGTFVGKSILDVSKPQDTLVFSLGRDKNVIVKREKISEFNKSQQFGSKKSEQFAWEISVRNNKKQEIELIIEDQVPVSNSKEIDVKYTDLANAIQDKNTGLIKWIVKLKASENKKLGFKYEVKYPADLVLQF